MKSHGLQNLISRLALACGGLLLMSTVGCNVLGFAAYVAPRPVVQPKYQGLNGQSVGVFVWADRAIQIDWNTLPLDLAMNIQQKLQAGQDRKHEREQMRFPVEPASIQRYIDDHPEVYTQDITQVAPNLGVSRLIYIEIEDFTTKAPASLDLYRGSMSGTLKIVEVIGQHAKVAYEEDGIKVVFPPKVPDDGTPRGNNYQFYLGTIDAFSTEIFHRLVPYRPEE
jgi:hypothetical protein